MGMTYMFFVLLAAFLLAGFIFTTVFGVAVIVGLVVNLVLLPLRIFLWVLKGILGIF